MGLALLLVSCEKEKIPTTINEVTDLYTVPADAVEMPSLSQAESVWSLDRRYFNLAFGSALSTTLVGYDALLTPGQYVLGDNQIGNAVLSSTKVNGQPASEGYITVNRDDKGTYHISATVDGKAYVWNGTMPFTPDPAATVLPVLQQAQSNVANGTNSVTLQLATEGIAQEFDWTTWQTTWTGEGGYLALDLFSDDGYLHEGTFIPSAEGGVINAGEFGIGWDPGDLYGIGMVFTDWGTCWWTVKDGAATATKITGGIVTVTKLEGEKAWRIAWGEKYPVEYVFEGDIPALTKPKKPEGGANIDYAYTDEVTPGDGIDTHAIKITDKNGEEMAYLEILTANGQTDLSGSYPSTSYAGSPGQMRDGYNFPDWGISGGSYYVKDGEKQYIGAGTATLVITKIATGAYKFSCEFFDYSAAGPDYVPEEGGEGGGDDVSGDVVLKLTAGLTYSMEDVTAANTDANQSPLSGMTLWRVTVSDGSGTVAAFDLGTAEGSSDLAGAYTVMSYPDAPGKAGNGWGFPAWGMVGGCYFVADGAYYYIPSEATINISNNADGTLKIKFEGSIQKDDYSDGGKGGLLLNNIAKS